MTAGRVLVSSIVRGAGERTTSGYLRVVDLGARHVLARCGLPESRYRESDPNQRGGARGARGVAVFGERVLIANNERLFIYDAAWRPMAEFSHPLLGDIHDVLPGPDGIWVASTSSDLMVKLGWDGTLQGDWEWRRQPELVRGLGFDALPLVDRTLDYRDPGAAHGSASNVVHLNNVSATPWGMLLSFGRVLSPANYARRQQAARDGAAGAAFASRVSGSASVFLAWNGADAQVLGHVAGTEVPNHNAMLIEGRLVYLDSNASRLVARSLDGGREQAVAIPGVGGFVRGLLHLGGLRFLVGNQAPLALYVVDLATGSVTDCILLPGLPAESPYGLCLLPDHFGDLPTALGPSAAQPTAEAGAPLFVLS